jgi:hypothetical protein
LHCYHCARSFAEDAIYCSQCGRKLQAGTLSEQTDDWPAALSEEAAALAIDKSIDDVGRMPDVSGRQEAGRSGAGGWIVAAFLACLAVVVAAVVYFYYDYEQNVNERVLKLQSEAKAAALSGKYEEALDLLSEAKAARPEFKSLAADEEIIHHVLKLDEMAQETERLLAAGLASEAEKSFEDFQSELSGRKEPIYDKMNEKLAEYNMKLTIIQLTADLESLTTVKEHGELLNVVNGLIGEEANALREEIIARIRNITKENVDDLVDKKSFSGAVLLIDQALAWAKGDEQLLALKAEVKEKQNAYVQREQQRIEQAMQRAAEEDLINQTAAVEVLRTEGLLDEFGDLTITGYLKNKATRPIYSVSIEYSVLDKEGNRLGGGTASVVPNYIEPGEEMTFTAVLYGVYNDETEIVVDHATWYLD